MNAAWNWKWSLDILKRLSRQGKSMSISSYRATLGKCWGGGTPRKLHSVFYIRNIGKASASGFLKKS